MQQNVDMEVSGTTLTIKVDLTKDYGLTASGKTHRIATTGGFASIEGVMVSLNVNKKV